MKDLLIENVHESSYIELEICFKALRGIKGSFHLFAEDENKSEVMLNIVGLEMYYDMRNYEVG